MPSRGGLLAVLALSTACATTPRGALGRAKQALDAGDAREALMRYDAVGQRADAGDDEHLAAWVGAARACDRLNDPECARLRLERAVEHDVPGKVERVEFELAERLRDRDRGRALSLYYRAASGAEKNLGGAFPYRAAMDRIVQLTMTH